MAKKYYQSETQQFYQKQNYEEPVPSPEEARLARVCAGLSSHLQEYKSENAQLEELRVAERELRKSCEARIRQLQKHLSAAKNEVLRAESSMAEALAAKNAEIEALVSSTDALKKQAAVSEGNLASLQALREELGAVDRRSEEERAAHNATKKAFMEREVGLEHRALEASTALARAQRTVDERTAKATELEQKVALLEVECATLNEELQDMAAQKKSSEEANQALQRTADESTAKATELEQKVALLEVECATLNQELQDMEAQKSSEEANQVLQMQARQEEMDRARQGQREAESKLASLEAEMQKLRVETAAMKRDAEHYSRQQVSGSSEGTAAGESKSAGDRLGLISKERAKKAKKRNLGWGALLLRRPRPQITEEQIGRTAGALCQRNFPKISVLAQCWRAVPGLPRRKSRFLKEV